LVQSRQTVLPLGPGTSCSGGRSSRSVDCPFPFREPVPAAPAKAFEVHHVSAALWADKIDDRRNHARVRFSWNCLDAPHGTLLISLQASPGKFFRVAKTRGAAKDRVRRLTCHGVFVAFNRSVLVDYGVRLGHLYWLRPRSVHDHANAVPNA